MAWDRHLRDRWGDQCLDTGSELPRIQTELKQPIRHPSSLAELYAARSPRTVSQHSSLGGRNKAVAKLLWQGLGPLFNSLSVTPGWMQGGERVQGTHAPTLHQESLLIVDNSFGPLNIHQALCSSHSSKTLEVCIYMYIHTH